MPSANKKAQGADADASMPDPPAPIIWPNEILIRFRNFNFFVTVALAIVYPCAIYMSLTHLRHRLAKVCSQVFMFSIPTESRTILSAMSAFSRSAFGIALCVMLAGCYIKRSTLPGLTANEAMVTEFIKVMQFSTPPPPDFEWHHAAKAIHYLAQHLTFYTSNRRHRHHIVEIDANNCTSNHLTMTAVVL
jgi:hypothetical protein